MKCLNCKNNFIHSTPCSSCSNLFHSRCSHKIGGYMGLVGDFALWRCTACIVKRSNEYKAPPVKYMWPLLAKVEAHLKTLSTLVISESQMCNIGPYGNMPDLMGTAYDSQKFWLDFCFQLDRLQQTIQMFNVEIINVPETSNENIMYVVERLGRFLNVAITSSDVVYARRIYEDGTTYRNIVVKFISRVLRDNLLKAVSRYPNGINAVDLKLYRGCPTSAIFVMEHLTDERKRLYRIASSMASRKKYQYLWVYEGIIMMKKNDYSLTHKITNRLELAYIE